MFCAILNYKPTECLNQRISTNSDKLFDMKKIITILILLATTGFYGHAQSDSTATANKNSVQVGKLYMAPIPMVASNPAFGLVYGIAASGSMFLGDPSTTNMSNGMVTATYSTKKQLMFTFKSNVYTKNNDWFLIGDWRLFFSSQPTYGLGTGPQANLLVVDDDLGEFELGDYIDGVADAELMDFNLIRFNQTALRQVKPNFYLGLGYHLDLFSKMDDHLLDLDTVPPRITYHYAYSKKHGFDPEKYTTSGVSFNAIYDSRDNVANPYTGRYAMASFKVLPTFLGSDQNATTLWLEYRDYFSVSKKTARNIIAVWTYFNLTTSGTLPYMALPAVGWDQMGRSGRAYPQGRWRGNNLFYAEVEYRVGLPLVKKNPDLLGAVVFADVTSASFSSENPELDVNLFEYFKPAAGLGLRIMIQKKSRLNIGLDYAWGVDGASAFYLSLNESF